MVIGSGLLLMGLCLGSVGFAMLVSPQKFLRYWSQMGRVLGWPVVDVQWSKSSHLDWRLGGLGMAIGAFVFLYAGISRLVLLLR
jgi:hypothetical protein